MESSKKFENNNDLYFKYGRSRIKTSSKAQVKNEARQSNI